MSREINYSRRNFWSLRLCPQLTSWLALRSAVAFQLLNPLDEELLYRGYTQPRLVTASHSLITGIVLTAIGFGLQHMVFAVTFSSALAYATAFFLWGPGAELIYHYQDHLIPLIIAHFVSNLSVGVIPSLMITQGR